MSGETRCTWCDKPTRMGVAALVHVHDGAMWCDDLRHKAEPAALSAIEVAPACEYCGPFCFQGAEHEARVQANAKYTNPLFPSPHLPLPSVAPGEAQRESQPNKEPFFPREGDADGLLQACHVLYDKLKAGESRITELEETLRKVVDICAVTDPCPYFGTGEYQNHSSGDCIQCKARAALAGTPSGKEEDNG